MCNTRGGVVMTKRRDDVTCGRCNELLSEIDSLRVKYE